MNHTFTHRVNNTNRSRSTYTNTYIYTHTGEWKIGEGKGGEG